ncbi:MAG: hypothetical protein HQ536_04785, partial [Parcubacteria group bacterium]|nr:hypothetical protein [Parcubacteria group bacterium]
MNKKIIIGIIALSLLAVIVVIGKDNNQQSNTTVASETINKTQTENIKNFADKIEVIHFHATQ